ncbi:MAG: hypothetical protein C0591_05310, partial [Marinilabiliales bacterium]
SGLTGVTTIGGSLIITGDTNLTNLNGLENISFINGELSIWRTALTNLDGLNNISAGSIDELYIRGNPSLSSCDVQSVCDYLANPNGTISIGGNAPGCNSQLEVEDECASFVGDLEEKNAISMYPNPATNELFIVCSNGVQITEINIYSQMGQKVLQVYGNTHQLDVSTLPKGLYVAELITDKSKIRRKLLLE